MFLGSRLRSAAPASGERRRRATRGAAHNEPRQKGPKAKAAAADKRRSASEHQPRNHRPGAAETEATTIQQGKISTHATAGVERADKGCLRAANPTTPTEGQRQGEEDRSRAATAAERQETKGQA